MIFQHHRFQILSGAQHPYRHLGGDIAYQNAAVPTGSVSNVAQAMDWIFAVLYPNTQGSVANYAALPATPNLLDYYIVLDDGDGKAAGYRWDQWEGEASPSWHKIYDMDWGEETILSGFIDKTQDQWVKRLGYDDLDPAGVPVTGILAGQKIYGGKSANTNLTLFANSGDGTGANTGFVQIGDNFRPTADNTYSIGESNRRIKDAFIVSLKTKAIDAGTDPLVVTASKISIGTTEILSGSLNMTGVGPEFSFTGIKLKDINTLTAANIVASTSLTLSNVSGVLIATLGSVAAGLITNALVDDNAAIAVSKLAALTAEKAVVTDANGKISASSVTATQIGYLSTTTSDVQTQLNGKADTVLGNLGTTAINADLNPAVTNNNYLGSLTKTWLGLYVSSLTYDADNWVSLLTLSKFRGSTTAIADGNTITWSNAANSGAGGFIPTAFTTDHGGLSGLSDDDHSQYALLAGRAGGQTLIGGINSTNSLTLRSTSHVTKGVIWVDSRIVPEVTNLTDLGDPSFKFKDVYTAGQFYGFRFEQSGTLPGAGSVGRAYYNTASNTLHVDDGSSFRKVGLETYEEDLVWNGVETSKVVTISSSISDGRYTICTLLDNSDSFVDLYPSFVRAATTVTVTFDTPPPPGTYRFKAVK